MNFYCLGPPLLLGPLFENKAIYGTAEWYTEFGPSDTEDTSYESITCSLNPRHKRAGARIGELHLVLPSPRIGDFIWTHLSECVITDKVVSLFREHNLRGFKPLNASIVKVKGSRRDNSTPFPQVWELSVTGNGGNAHHDSGIRLLYACPECKRPVYSSFRNGIIVDESQWDGSDFFIVKGYPRYVLITERVRDLIDQNKLTNCAVVRSEELKWGNLPRPEDRAEYSTPSEIGMITKS